MSIPASPQQQRLLLALQQVDSEIARLRRRAADLPEQREADRTAQELRHVAGQMTGLLDGLQALRDAAGSESPAEAERLRARLAEVKARGERLAARHREALAAVPDAAAAVEAGLAEARARRDGLAGQLDQALLAAYEAARRRLGGLAIVPLSARGTCGGCHLAISAVQLDRIRTDADTALPRCPECERYLVVA